MPWYYANNNQRLGPVSDTEFARLAREKIVRDDTLVWQHGMPDWKNYAEIAPALPLPEVQPSGIEATPLQSDSVSTVLSVSKAAAILAEQPVALRYASFWERAGAALIDWLLVLGLARLLAEILHVSEIDIMPLAQGDLTQLVPLLKQLSLYVFADSAMRVAFYWFFLKKCAATPGKMIFGLEVVRGDGSKLSDGQIIGRFFAEIVSKYFTLGFGYLMAAFDNEGRAMHDQMCDTRVVKKTRK